MYFTLTYFIRDMIALPTTCFSLRVILEYEKKKNVKMFEKRKGKCRTMIGLVSFLALEALDVGPVIRVLALDEQLVLVLGQRMVRYGVALVVMRPVVGHGSLEGRAARAQEADLQQEDEAEPRAHGGGRLLASRPSSANLYQQRLG